MRYKADYTDLIAVIGLALLAAGLYFIYPPLALVIPGAVLLLVGLAAGRRGGSS